MLRFLLGLSYAFTASNFLLTRGVLILCGWQTFAFGRLCVFSSVGYCAAFGGITLSIPPSSKIQIRLKSVSQRQLKPLTLKFFYYVNLVNLSIIFELFVFLLKNFLFTSLIYKLTRSQNGSITFY